MNISHRKNRFLLVSLFLMSLHVTPLFAAGNAKPTNAAIKFALFPRDYFTSYKTDTPLTGTDSRGMVLSGGINEKALPKVTFMGNLAIPIETVIVFTSRGMTFGLATVNHYYSTQVNTRRYLGFDGDIRTVKASTTPLPVRASIGNSGKVGTYIDSRNFKTVLTWELKDGFNGKAKFILLNKTSKPSGELDNTTKTTYLISQNGYRESIEMEVYNHTVKMKMTFKGKYK